ncbi:MAG: ferrochelatase [Methylomonas sp.]|jgi:ferrochelatase
MSIKRGILLVNLGSPASTKIADVRRFLAEFLSDPRVVDLPPMLWRLILYLFILPFRPAKSAHAYRRIWTDDGSPLIAFTRQLTAKLQARLANDDILIECAMRYGQPGLADKLRAFKSRAVDEIVILPLYPQYSSTTTASVFDAAAKVFCGWRRMPGLRFISDYHQHPLYIAALAETIRAHWRRHGQPELLLMSFHGLPARLTELGDPYFHQCQCTAQLLATALALADDKWRLVFQSRFGKAEWLRPYCIEVLQDLPKQGIKSIDVICPGFAVDCLETLEEIALTNKAVFIGSGGVNYRYIPALNAGDAHVELIINIISAHC